MIKPILLGTTVLIGIGVASYVFTPSLLPTPVVRAGDALTKPLKDPDKLGWMDDAMLTTADRERIAEITGSGRSSDDDVIRGIQAGSRGSITRRDFELLRQDRRRAQAAYPDVPHDDLLTSTWVQVDVDARVPMDWCNSGNSNGTEVGDKFYLDGGCLMWIVSPKYTKRTDALTTKRVLTEIRDRADAKVLRRYEKWGYSSSWSGTGESMSIDCNPRRLPSDAHDTAVPGKCVLVVDEKKQYVFPFVPSEWVHSSGLSLDNAKVLPSFKFVAISDYVKPASKPWIREDGILAKGEHCAPGRLCFSHWNGDGYDNEDIGSDHPTCWKFDGGLFTGLNYLPCSVRDRGSTPGSKWTLSASYYGGYSVQLSDGWTEAECKAAMPKLLTGQSFGLQGQDPEDINRGNSKEVRCFEDGSEHPQGVALADRTMPVPPLKPPEPASCVQGGTLMPGQSCTTRF